VAAGVLLQTAGSLQEKSLSTGQQARAQISTNAETIEVSATDGQDAMLNDFNQLLKLAPGSDEIKLDQVIFTFNTMDKTSTLKYRGTEGICRMNVTSGYMTRKEEVIEQNLDDTWYTLEEDIDYDGTYTDQVRVSDDNRSLEFSLSTAGGINVSLGADITNAGSVPVTLDVEKQNINEDNASFGKVQINGTTDQNGTLLSRMVTVYPYKEGEGYFTVEYLQTGTNHIEGNLQKGDLIKMCYEAPQDIGEDVEVRLNFIPKIGTATLTEFVTPDVISTERVYLYP
jgi:archaellin